MHHADLAGIGGRCLLDRIAAHYLPCLFAEEMASLQTAHVGGEEYLVIEECTMIPSKKLRYSDPLALLVAELEAISGPIAATDLSDILERSTLTIEDVAVHVEPSADTYTRRRIARSDHFEVLVLTWKPGQGGDAHDHSGSLSGFKILKGTARETLFASMIDGLVEPMGSGELREGEVGIDPAGVIHSVRNDASSREMLVSLHIYAPPLPELRRYKLRTTHQKPAAALLRTRHALAPITVIVGGGFSGIMVACHLARETEKSDRHQHIVIIDRQTSIAEGAAYRTPDSSHLLNVPASNMSAWPDMPADFLEWAQSRDPAMTPYSFLPRQTYGDYLHHTLFKTIADAGANTSVEIRCDEVESVAREGGAWRVKCTTSEAIHADLVVLATGHRAPDDPLARIWSGSRARYIHDPWAALALAAIAPDESVCILGTGLTAVDVLQTLLRSSHTAPVLAISRRGLMPTTHTERPLAPIDPRSWLDKLLHASPVTTRKLVRALRLAAQQAGPHGEDWRRVIDGLRAFTPQIWQALTLPERRRFMRHVRAHWEVVRHRLAPAIAQSVRIAKDTGVFDTLAARVVSARGEVDGVTLTMTGRGKSNVVRRKFAWVVNCTGPGSGSGFGLGPLLEELATQGHLQRDPLGIGFLSTEDGRALVEGKVIDDLLIVGTLRKPDLWESTAVPELRHQAARAAAAIQLILKRPG